MVTKAPECYMHCLHGKTRCKGHATMMDNNVAYSSYIYTGQGASNQQVVT